jgi:hypothetical protein
MVECFVRQLKEEMCAECTSGGGEGRGEIGRWANPESIQCTVKDQASPLPPLLQQVVYLPSPPSCVSPPIELTDGREGGGGAKSYDGKKSLVLYNTLNTL